MNKEINILSMFRNKNKSSFFSIHQIHHKIKSINPAIDVKFHILWDNNQELGGEDETYVSLINKLYDPDISSYTREFLNSYCKEYYGISESQIEKFGNFPLIYRILLGQYLRRTKLMEYFIILDDDILINYDLKDIIEYSANNIPFLITEPMNTNCDKVLFNSLNNLYENNSFHIIYQHRNPSLLGCNAGFQGIDASIFDDFLSPNNFAFLLSLFDYTSTKNPDGSEFFGPKRFLLDTQEQSFFSLMNISKSKKTPVILNPNEYFVIPNWGVHPIFGKLDIEDENEGWTFALKSKITHFIGHTQGKGKPKTFFNHVDLHLKKDQPLYE